MKERNHAFDFLCGICIIRMVSLHTIQVCGHRFDTWFDTLMCWSFYFMCFFFFKAGYFNKTVSGDTRAYILDKSKRLLIPYACWGLISFIHYAAFIPFEIDRYKHPIDPMEWNHLWDTSAVWGNIPLWFLFSFWASYVMVHLIKKIHIIKPISVFQTLIILLCPLISYLMYRLDNPLPMSLNNVFMGIFFFNLGRTWHWVIDHLSRKQSLILSCSLIILFCVSNVFWHGEYQMLHNEFTGNPLGAFFNTTFILLGLSGLLLKYPLRRVPVINFIGQHSMVYFVTHYIILQFYRLIHIVNGRGIYGRYDDFVILILVTFCICSWLVPYVEAVPWLSGRWKNKPKLTETQQMTNPEL